MDRSKKCRGSICRRFLKSLTDNGITSFEDIQTEHVRNFIVKIKEAIEKATSDFDPLFSNEYDIDWEDDEDLLKKLYGLK